MNIYIWVASCDVDDPDIARLCQNGSAKASHAALLFCLSFNVAAMGVNAEGLAATGSTIDDTLKLRSAARTVRALL